MDLLPLAVALWIAGRVALAWWGRVFHPFDLEWMEGGMLAHAWRLQHGLPLYVEPGPEFVPFIYPPGYSALLAALGSVVGLDYAVGRLVSVLGVLAAACAIVFLGVRQAGSWLGGLCGAAAYMGLFRASGGFYDLVRPDALGVGLVAWSVALALERRRGAEVASGLLLCAAFLVKHNFAAFGVPLVLGLWMRPQGLWPAIRFTLASAVPALALTVLWQIRSDGRFLTYLLEVPRAHPMLWERLAVGMPGEMGMWLMPALLVGAGWLWWTASSEGAAGPRWVAGAGALVPAVALGAWGLQQPAINGVPMGSSAVAAASLSAIGLGLGAVGVALVGWARGRRPSWRWVLGAGVGAMALVLAGLMRAHFGGFMNVLMPAHWAATAGLAVVVGQLRQRDLSGVLHGASLLVLVVQLGWIGRTLQLQDVVPTADDVAAGQAAVATVQEACEGAERVLAPHVAWLPVQAGHPPSIHMIAIWDLNHAEGPYVDEVKTVLPEAAKDHYWGCVVQGTGRHQVKYGVQGQYEHARWLQPPANAMRPMTGWRVRPTEILTPRTSP